MQRKNKYLIQFALFSFVFVLFCFLMLIFSYRFKSKIPTFPTSSENNGLPTVIIDAGHGGKDGGAVGINGVIEKDLNLKIAKSLCDMLKSNGFDVVMTRNDDRMLCDENTVGSKKTADLKKRISIAKNYENPVFISIHMNSFPSEKYSGTQVYYSPSHIEKSSLLADTLQYAVKENLQKDNTRKTKLSSGNIYILKNIDCPAVLIECGFISNRRECDLLCDENYRQKLSLTFCSAISQFIYSQYS